MARMVDGRLIIDGMPVIPDRNWHGVMDRIDNQDGTKAALSKQVLRWVFCRRVPSEPLYAFQLQQAIAVEQGHAADDTAFYVSVTELESACLGFIAISKDESPLNQKVKPSHPLREIFIHRHYNLYFPDKRIQLSLICLRHLDQLLENDMTTMFYINDELAATDLSYAS